MKYSDWRSMRMFVSLLLAVLSLGAITAHADIIIDNGGSGTSSTGTWAVSGGTTPYGSNSLWARDGATYTWQFASQPAGTYEVSMWWSGLSSRATNVPVTIVHRDGSATVSVNQRFPMPPPRAHHGGARGPHSLTAPGLLLTRKIEL